MTVPHLFTNFVGSATPPIGTWYFEPEFSQHAYGTPDYQNLKRNIEPVGAVCLDGSGNVYTLFTMSEGNTQTSTHGSAFIVLVKTNSSGVRQWSRFIYGNNRIFAFGMDIDNTNHRIYICGSTQQNADGTTSNNQTNESLGWVCRIDSINTSTPSVSWSKYLAADQTSTRTTGNSNAFGVTLRSIKVNPVNGYIFAIGTSYGYYGAGLGTGSGTNWSDPQATLMFRFDVGSGSTQECKIINPVGLGNVDSITGVQTMNPHNLAFNSTGHVYAFFEWDRSDGGTDFKDGILVAKFSSDTNLDMQDCWEISAGVGDERSLGKFEIDSSDNFHITYQGATTDFFKSNCSTYLMANSSRVAQRTKRFQRYVASGSPYYSNQTHALCGSTHIYLISSLYNFSQMNSIWVQKKQIGSDTVDQEYIIENQLTDDVNDNDAKIASIEAACDGTYLYLTIKTDSTQYPNSANTSVAGRQNSSYLLQLPVADFSSSLPSSVPTKWSNRVRSNGWDGFEGDNKLTIKAKDWTPSTYGVATLSTSSSAVSWTSLGTNSSDYSGNDTGASMTSFNFSTFTMSATITTEGGSNVDLTTIKTEI